MRCTQCMGPMTMRRGAMRCSVCGAVADEVSADTGIGAAAADRGRGLWPWALGVLGAGALVGGGAYLALVVNSPPDESRMAGEPAVPSHMEAGRDEPSRADELSEGPVLVWTPVAASERGQPILARATAGGGALAIVRVGAFEEAEPARVQAVLMDEQGAVRYRQMLSGAYSQVLAAHSDAEGGVIAVAGAQDGALIVERAGGDGAVWTYALGESHGDGDHLALDLWDGAPVIFAVRGDGQGVAGLQLGEGGDRLWRREWPWRSVQSVKTARGPDGRALVAVSARRPESGEPALYWEVLDGQGQTIARGAEAWSAGARLDDVLAVPGGGFAVLVGGPEPSLALLDRRGEQVGGWRLPALSGGGQLRGAASRSGYFIAATAEGGDGSERGWLLRVTKDGRLALGNSAPLEAGAQVGPMAIDERGGLRLTAIGGPGAVRPGLQLGSLEVLDGLPQTADGADADWVQLDAVAPWLELPALLDLPEPGELEAAAADTLFETVDAASDTRLSADGPAESLGVEGDVAAAPEAEIPHQTETLDQQEAATALDAPPELRLRDSAAADEASGEPASGPPLTEDAQAPDDAIELRTTLDLSTTGAIAGQDDSVADVLGEDDGDATMASGAASPTQAALRFACRFSCVSAVDPEIAFPLAQTITVEQPIRAPVLEAFVASHPEEYCAPLRLDGPRIAEAACAPETSPAE